MKKLFTFFTLIACGSLAYADNGKNDSVYVDLGYTALTYNDSGRNWSPTAARIMVGQNTWSNFGLEGMLGAGLTSNKQTVSGIAFTVSIPTMYGLYVKAYTNVSEDFELFGRLGYTGWSRKLAYNSTSISNSGSALSYGVGAKYAITKSTTVSADYMVYQNGAGSDAGLTGFTFGVGYNF